MSDDSRPASPLPEAGNDPGDSGQPDDRDPPTPPAADPTRDMDLSDDDSVLSDVDEAQFADFDVANIAIEERPIAVDEDTAKLLTRHKRKRDPEEGDRPKKKKEGRREKPKKKKRDEEDNFSGGEELQGKRKRKSKPVDEEGEKKSRAKPRPVEEDEEGLDPEERMFSVDFCPYDSRTDMQVKGDGVHLIELWTRPSRTQTGDVGSRMAL
jgi:transcription factor SPN1